MCEDFARLVLRVGGVYLYLHAWSRLATGTLHKKMLVFVTNDRSALCHAITDGVGETNLVQEVFHLLVEGCPSDDALVEVATERGIELVADLPVHHLLEDGDGGEGTDAAGA